MPTAPVDHGQMNKHMRAVTVDDGIKGTAIGSGSFTIGGTTTIITDAEIPTAAKVVVFPLTPAGGLVLKTHSCSAVAAAGSIVFTVSATGSGLPTGSETMAYVWISES